MKKTLKKTLSIILAILMIASTVPFAFAAGDGAPLTIDVAQEERIEIGSGYEYYDEDGYTLTGTSEDGWVDVYESCDLTLKDVTLWQLLTQYAPEGSVMNITLEGTNEVAGFVAQGDEHLVFDGDETASFKAPYLATAGRNGTVTVNSGNIVLERVADSYSSTINCADFIINGGTVTASNNYGYTVFSPVKLNGGTLNIINTSTDYEAIFANITMKKGALLTVSGTYGLINESFNILMADGLAEGNSFFVRYDKTSDFAPVYDIKAALENKNYAEIKVDAHTHVYANGVCSCGLVCEHDTDEGECSICGKYFYKITHQPTAAEPYVKLNNDTNAKYQWYKVELEETELTDENAEAYSYGGKTASYDSETGWTPVLDEDDYYSGATIELNKGDTVTVVFEESGFSYLGFWDYEIEHEGAGANEKSGVTSYTLTMNADGNYTVYTSYPVNHKVYLTEKNNTKLDGQTAATLANPVFGSEYVCEVTFKDDTTEMSEEFEYVYAITHQPTEAEPYVKLNDDTDASYQWYSVAGEATEITDENAEVFSGGYGTASYDETEGWTGVPSGFEDHNQKALFSIDLEKDDIVSVEFSEEISDYIVLYDKTNNKVYSFDIEESTTNMSVTVPETSRYELEVYLANPEVTVKAYLGQQTYTAVDGQTSATLTPAELGKYVCEVTFKDDTTETSETVEITTLHTHSGGTATCVAPAKCEICGEPYGEAAANAHDWGNALISRPTQNTDGTWNDGYYYYVCNNDSEHTKTGDVAKRGDYEKFNELLSKAKAYYADETLTDEAKAEVAKIINLPIFIYTPQNLVEAELNGYIGTLNNLIAKIEAGIADGTMLKADYTEVDEAIAGIDAALEYATISDEMKAELEDIKSDLEALKGDADATKADFADEIASLVERAEAITEAMAGCASGKHSFTNYVSDNNATCTADGTKTAECVFGCGTEDTVTDEDTMLDHVDEDGNKLCDECTAEIVDTCPDCGRKAHADKGIPEYICLIITFIKLVVSFFNAVK